MVTIEKSPKESPDWSNLSIIHRNTLPPRSSFFLYNTETEALTYDSTKSNSICLSGTWKFYLGSSPAETPDDFFSMDFDTSMWRDIQVPSMWQLQEGVGGRGPQYTNTVYPFPVDPPNVPLDENETGCYVRRFVVPGDMGGAGVGVRFRLRFEGVDSAFHVWVNGVEVGYSQGARNPSEFDVTEVVEGCETCTVCVRVYQWSDGSYIEDQDQWWLSGIFRDVYLLAFPKTHFEDFQVQTLLDDEYRDAKLSVKVNLSGAADVELKLLDSEKNEVVRETKSSSDGVINFNVHVENPSKWTAETPTLYHLVLTFVNGDQVIAQRVGFRKTEIKNGQLLVNGNRIVFRGTNRHEHHYTGGRTVPYEFLKNDLLLMKTHNLNAIRTSHQPNDPRLYDLADELGLWIIDEADLECHGFADVMEEAFTDEQKKLSYPERKKLSYEAASKWTTDNPDWEEAYLDRARQLVMRDKNHPSIIMWSLGNEAFYGRNFQSMYDLVKSIDPTRPVHYEGDIEAKTVDVFSMMYASVATIIEFAEVKDYTKPLILCEYIHAMGNGPGSIKEYVDAFYKYPRLQGGFVWEWANHGLLTKNDEGEEYYAYGGDFGEQVHDSNFVMDGVLFSNHTPSPGLIEYKKAIEPVQVLSVLRNPMFIEIINRYDFVTLDHLECNGTLVGDGFEESIGKISIPRGIQPGQTAKLAIPELHDARARLADTYVTISFALKKDTLWAKAGHEIAWGQVKTAGTTKEEPALQTPTSQPPLSITKLSPTILSIKGTNSTWKFDTAKGTITSWTKPTSPTTENLTQAPELSFYRALTDNDTPSAGANWRSKRLHQTKPHIQTITPSTAPQGTFILTTQSRIAPPVLEWSVTVTTTYTFSNANLQIHVSGKPSGINLPRTFARIGLTLGLNSGFRDVEWFGRGPGESYSDKKLSQRFGTWKMGIEELWTEYEYPQEGGNRMDVKYVVFTGSSSHSDQDGGKDAEIKAKASFGTQQGCSFNASHYRVEDIDAARHPYELERKRREEVVLRLDWRHMGLGSGSCGPDCLAEYELLSDEEFEFDLWLE